MVCVGVTIGVSLVTKPRSRAELEGLVMGASAIPTSEPGRWNQEPIFWGGAIAVVFVVVNIALW